MSIVNLEKLSTLSKDGKFNTEIIDYAKSLILSQLESFLEKRDILELIKERLTSINYKVVSREEFKTIYENANGQGLIPGAFVLKNTIYLKDTGEINQTDFHQLVHEIMHMLSNNNVDKQGMWVFKTEDNQTYYYGYGINECATEYITSLVLDEAFYGYSRDLKITMQLIIQILDWSNSSLMENYFQNEDWLTEDLCSQFNSDNIDSLPIIVSEYDQRLPNTRRRDFNPNSVLNSFIDAIKNKIDANKILDYTLIKDLLSELEKYYADWLTIDAKTSENIKMISKLCTEKASLNNSVSNVPKA